MGRSAGDGDSNGFGSEGRRGRLDPRVVQTRSRVLAATRTLIAREGITSASVERIATRSGVARSTIYRRWPDLNALYADALLSTGNESPDAPPPTGDIRTDLRRYLAEYADRLNDATYFPLLVSLILLADRDPRFAQAHRQTVNVTLSQAADIIEAGQRTGALRADLDRAHAIVLLLGPLLYVRILEHRRITPARIDTAVDEFLERYAT